VDRDDRTDIGGPGEVFRTTEWTQVFCTQTDDTTHRREAVGVVLERYWKPVYCFLRRKGHDNDAAKDITQGFFCEVVLGRDLLPRADRAKGKFRTFLLTALERYVIDRHRMAVAGSRRPAGGIVSLAGIDGAELPEPSQEASPEQAFYHAWASSLLDEVIGEVAGHYADVGQTAYWAVFRERCLSPILEGCPPTPLDELCHEHGIADPKRVTNMVVTVKRRLARTLRGKVRTWVDSDEQVDAEVRDLMEFLSCHGAAQG